LDTPYTFDQAISRFKSDQRSGFGHIKAQLLSLGHTPGKAQLDLNAGDQALNCLHEFMARSGLRADAVEDLAGRRWMFCRRQEHPAHISQIHVVAKFISRKVGDLDGRALSQLLCKLAPPTTAAPAPRTNHCG